MSKAYQCKTLIITFFVMLPIVPLIYDNINTTYMRELVYINNLIFMPVLINLQVY